VSGVFGILSVILLYIGSGVSCEISKKIFFSSCTSVSGIDRKRGETWGCLCTRQLRAGIDYKPLHT
jgi:hypothetical protein